MPSFEICYAHSPSSTNIRRMLESRVKQVAARKPLLAASLVSIEPVWETRLPLRFRREDIVVINLPTMYRGKTRTVYVPVDFTDEVRSWIDEHRRLKRLLQEFSQLSLALVRSHAQERKRRQGRL